MDVIKIQEVINSTSADEDTKGDIIFEKIQKIKKDGSTVVLDFEGIELINTAFLNNAIGRLFNRKEYDIDKNPVRIAHMKDSAIDLFKESVRVACEKYR
ncbi:MAG: STAS-like domain-containing protein [Lachnospiraceae bacterium]|nr:STAS-like domain-containing protein [Lachnospiraceae bacterium]